MLRISNLNVKIGDKVILNDINIQMIAGEILLITGHNGSGKSTLLHSIMGRPDLTVGGTIEVDGDRLDTMACHERARAGVFMFHQSPPTVDGVNTMVMFNEINKVQGSLYSRKELITNSKKIFSDLNLPSDWDKRQFNAGASGGERKKNELAQAELFSGRLLLLDEPDSGLDQGSRQHIVDLISKNQQRGGFTILVSHDKDLQQMYSSKNIELQNGRIIQSA